MVTFFKGCAQALSLKKVSPTWSVQYSNAVADRKRGSKPALITNPRGEPVPYRGGSSRETFSGELMGNHFSTARRGQSLTGWLPGFEPEVELPFQVAALTQPTVEPLPPQATVAMTLDPHASLVTPPSASTAHVEPPALLVEEIEVVSTPAMAAAIAADAQAMAEPEVEPVTQKHWPHFDASRYEAKRSVEQRAKVNLEAIRLLMDLRQGERPPTDEERHTLLSYSGWGGAGRVFETGLAGNLSSYQEELQKLLTQEEFDAARSSTVSAYYTPTYVVNAMWNMVRQLGFTGGRVIEPTAATGRFLAQMPHDIAVNSEVTAVELDAISAEIAQQVFGTLGAQMQHSALEKANLPEGFFDLAIANVPFGDFKSLETRKLSYANWSIHNYCLARCIDLVRPGGLVVAVTSSATMDSSTTVHRDWMNAHAELLGAVRLPTMVFDSTGAEVTTDILVLKRRERVKFEADYGWKGVVQAGMDLIKAGQDTRVYSRHSGRYVDRRAEINRWFVQHPHALLGQLVFTTGQYGRGVLQTQWQRDQQQLEQRLSDLALSMPAGAFQAQQAVQPQGVVAAGTVARQVEASGFAKPGAFVMQGQRVCIAESPTTWLDVDALYTGKVRERLQGMMGIRDVARRLIELQLSSDDDSAFKGTQTQLNIRYDEFVAKHGLLTEQVNVRVFRNDPDCALLLSLERFDESLEKWVKADIFSRRTAGRREPPGHVSDVRDAMLIALAQYGRINVGDMAQRLLQPHASVTQTLRQRELAYLDPMDRQWKPADEYLSGNIREKIAQAQAAGQRYAVNVQALTRVLPKDLGPSDVEARLGAPWIPVDVVRQFLFELVQAGENENLEVRYDTTASQWHIDHWRRENFGTRTLNNSEWGTKDRCAVDLLEAALNQVPPVITRTNADGSTYKDRPATLAAREKYEAIKERFKLWVYQDDTRRDRLLRIYNDQFNQIVVRKYDGSHLTLPGMSFVIAPYPSQLNAIWRAVCGGNMLLGHPVGAGKTFIMMAAAMEMRRIGKANKPVIVVPNNLLEQVAGDCVRFYPNAKVMMATKEDLSAERRKLFTARVATGDWDAVVMTHSTFERLPLNPKSSRRFVTALLEQARWALEEAKSHGGNRKSVYRMEKALKTLEAKFEKALAASKKDDLVYFEDLGLDYIMFDEAHALKNLMRISKMKNIAGLPNAASNRAFDAWTKFAVLGEMRGDADEGVLLSTATPIANSIAEMHVMQKYLQPRTLKKLGLYEFDAWAATFGESVQGMELSPDGAGYRLNTRFSRFVNVPELVALFHQVADIKTRAELSLPTPKVLGGKPTVISVKPSAELKKFTAELVKRAERVRNGAVKPNEDNMLKITGSGRKAALDMRLVDYRASHDPHAKLAAVVKQVLRIYRETDHKRGTQLVFCDLSTPSTVGFSVYIELRDLLVLGGIPADEIAFVQDHASDSARAKLFRDVRNRKVRVLLGSTAMMGLGTNVQAWLKAVHQIEPPWRPADVEQRDGRGLRAGNNWEEIELLRYVTEGSFDAYTWQLLETKAKFIEQVLVGKAGVRKVDDLAMGALTYAEIKAMASGNPLVLEKATVEAELSRLHMLHGAWRDDQWQLQSEASSNRSYAADMEASMPFVVEQAERVRALLQSGAKLFEPAHVDGAKAIAQLPDASAIGTLLNRIRSGMDVGRTRTVGRVAGLRLTLHKNAAEYRVVLESEMGAHWLRFEVQREGIPITRGPETGQAVLDTLKEVVEQPAYRAQRIVELRQQADQCEEQARKEWPHTERLMELRKRLDLIDSELDLDKDEAGTEAMSEVASEEKEAATVE